MSHTAAPKPAARQTYRLSAAVNDWLTAEAVRLGVSRSAVIDMKLSALMTAESQPFTGEQTALIERMISEALRMSMIATAVPSAVTADRPTQQWTSETQRKHALADLLKDDHD